MSWTCLDQNRSVMKIMLIDEFSVITRKEFKTSELNEIWEGTLSDKNWSAMRTCVAYEIELLWWGR